MYVSFLLYWNNYIENSLIIKAKFMKIDLAFIIKEFL